MKAVQVTDGLIHIDNVPEPRGEGITVHVKSVGICGSDLHLIDSGMMSVIPGHEIAGVTSNGTEVAIEPMLSCGTCKYCLGGEEPYCKESLPRTLGIGIDGGMAERVVVPERFLVPLDPRVSIDNAFLTEPLAVAVRSLGRVGIAKGDRVCVIGAGTIGLCCVAAAVHMGAIVELESRHSHQLEAGIQLGAVEPSEQPAQVVIEAAGTGSSLSRAIEKCEKGGVVGIPSTYWEPVEIPALTMGMKEVSLIPSITYGHTTGHRDFELAMSVLANSPLLGSAVITHRYPLDGASEAFERARLRRDGVIKVAIDVAT
tara:strand:- start:305 stop:1246 length:942 start_codon:yes stop_codon:yes gene_type:complete